MQIDPRRLRFLLAVARSGGVLAAADELHMTPSAVSQQITRLEAESGCELLTRTPQGSALTREGRVLAEAARDIERTLLDATTRLDQGDAELRGVVRIGGFQSFLAVKIIPALPEWKRQLPGVRFEIVEGDRDPLLRSLKAGELDAAIIEFDAGEPQTAPPRGATEVPLLDEPWKLVVPAGTLLSEVMDLGQLNLPWLGVVPGAASAQAVKRLQRLAGTAQSTAHRYYATQTALALVAAGEGMALIPSLALHGMPVHGLDVLDVPGLGARRIVLRSYFRGKQAQGLITAVTALIRDAATQVSSEPAGTSHAP